MTTTKLPAISHDAAGQFGGAMIASHWKGKPYQKRYVRPHDPKTQIQIARRARVKFLCNAWRRLNDAEKATWEPLRHRRDLPLYNVFLAENMPIATLFGGTYKRGDHLGSTQTSPGHVLTATPIARGVRLDWTAPATQPSWCWCLLRQTTPFHTIRTALDAIAYLDPGPTVLQYFDFHPVLGTTNRYWILDFHDRNSYSSAGAPADATPLP